MDERSGPRIQAVKIDAESPLHAGASDRTTTSPDQSSEWKRIHPRIPMAPTLSE